MDKPAKAAWRQLIPMLDDMGVLSRIDGVVLERYCVMLARWREAEEFIKHRGSTYAVRDQRDKVVALKRYPQVMIAGDLADKLLRLEQSFGLSPSARARLQVPATRPDWSGKERFGKLNCPSGRIAEPDPAAEFFNGKN